MQKVVGSSPIIRFDESPGNRAFFIGSRCQLWRESGAWKRFWKPERSGRFQSRSERSGAQAGV
jgi:hypothetical protein